MSKVSVYMDACCFIDLAAMKLDLETEAGRENHIYFCRKLLEAARAKEALVYTSFATIVECGHVVDLSRPSGQQKIWTPEVQRLFRGLLQSGSSGVLPVATTPLVTERALDLKWKHNITCRAMDALHLASALKAGCTHFITTDNFGTTNIAGLALLGLVVCRAEAVSNLLPSKYSQIEMVAQLSGKLKTDGGTRAPLAASPA